MTRLIQIPKLWLVLGLVYAALLAWHQPLRGPLSEDEVRAAFAGQFEQLSSSVQLEQIQNSQGGQAAAILDFFLNDDGRPFFMVNLNKLPEQTAEIDAAARSYGAFMAPRLLLRASYPVLTTDVIVGLTNTLGDGVEDADRLVVVRYRSRRDFLEIVSTPEFRVAVQDKAISLNGWYSAPASIGPTLSVPLVGLIVLLAVGSVGTAFARRRTQRSDRQSSDIADAELTDPPPRQTHQEI